MKLPVPKTAYISDQHYPIEKADSEQVVNTVSALAAEGVDIKLIIPRDWTTFGIPKAERVNAINDFYRLPNGLATAELLQLPLSRLRLEKYSHGIIAPFWAKLARYQIIYTRNPLPALVAHLLGLKVIYETYRIHDSDITSLLTRSKNFIGIITHSQPSKESLINSGAREEKVRVIHNGFNLDLFSEPILKNEARQKLGLGESEKIACYTGRLDKEKGIGALIELAALTPGIRYYFIGKTQKDPESWIQGLAEKKNLSNIKCIPWMTADKLRDYFFAADVLLIPPTAEPLYKYGKTVLPMKLFQYMAVGRPILAPILPDMRQVLNDNNAILVEPDNLEEAQNKIRQVFEKPDWADSVAEQAQIDSRNYTWQGRAQKIISFVNERLSDD